jgi:hypothetical protein
VGRNRYDQRFQYRRKILRAIWSVAYADGNAICNCNGHSDPVRYGNRHGYCNAETDANAALSANASAAPYSGASAVVLDVHCKPKVLAALYGCHDLAFIIQALR